MARSAILLALALVGCGSEGTSEPPEPTEDCVAPNRLVGELCLAPATQDNGCAAGTWLQEDGSCAPAGVTEALCAEGFEHDGDRACEPVLPSADCPPGQMAVPGDPTCRPVMPCAAGTWGDLPVDGETQHVDAAFAGTSDGSAASPWTTISDAVQAAAPGALVAVTDGTYAESVAINKPIRLWGVCPERVTVSGGLAAFGALNISNGAEGSEIGGLRITGSQFGIAMTGSLNVLVDRVWIDNPGWRGIHVEQSPSSPSGITVRDSLVEGASEFAIILIGVQAAIERVQVRDTQTRAGVFGRPLSIELDQDNITSPVVSVSGSLLERGHDSGLIALGGEVTVEGTVVRDIQPIDDGRFGRAISIESDRTADIPSVATLRGSYAARSHEVGLFVTGSTATIEGMVVRDTAPRPDGFFGRGLSVQVQSETGLPAAATVVGTLVDGAHDCGLRVSGAEAHLLGVAVRNVLPSPADASYGRGLSVDTNINHNAPSYATLAGVHVSAVHDMGAFFSSPAVVDGILVADIVPNGDGNFGDGIAFASRVFPIAATFVNSDIANAPRAGLTVFGADVGVANTLLRCHGVDMNVEPFQPDDLGPVYEPILTDFGANLCGCPDATEACKAVSTALEPPSALGD